MFEARDQEILRELARRVAEIAELEVQAERRELWKRHNSLKPLRPMLLVFPEGSWSVDPLLLAALRARPRAPLRARLRQRLYYDDHFGDDTVTERESIVHKAIDSSGWGLDRYRRAHRDGEPGASIR